MKKNFKSTIKCLLVSLCLAGVGAFMFASMGYADGTIQSIEGSPSQTGENNTTTWEYFPYDNIAIGSENHSSRGYNNIESPLYADHGTSQWQELGKSGGSNDYGISWSINGGDFGHEDAFLGDSVTFSFTMHSGDAGTHYANILGAWIKKADASVYEAITDYDNNAVSYKILREENNGNLISGYNDNITVTYTIDELTEDYLGTSYVRARATCTESIVQTDLGAALKYSIWYQDYYYSLWDSQWRYGIDQYLNAFSAYNDYYQGEIEEWMFTVSGNPPGSAVPEPTTLALFGMGLIGLARVGRKKA